MIKIGISIGHNCSMDTGSVGFILEDKVNKEVSEELIKLISNDPNYMVINVTPSWAEDIQSSLAQRVIKAIENLCDILIDIHHNAGGGRGTEIYYNNEKSKALGAKILEKITSLGYKNRGLKINDFYILKAKMPTILYEGWFVDNREDTSIYNPRLEAKAIYQGIVEFLGESNIVNNNSEENYINLHPIRSSWNVYPLNKQPIVGNQCGALNPKMYNGLTYKILGNPQKDVYIIETQNFGRVKIYVPIDNESKLSNKILY